MISKNPRISVIVPFYNAKSYINTCLDILLKQDLTESFEIVMIDDASTDNGNNIIKKKNSSIIKLHSLPSNLGPAAARNLGLKKSKGEYIFFLDVDDTISKSTLSILYRIAKESNYDLVMSDKKWIENSDNQRQNIFFYPTDQTFGVSEIMDAMRNRFYNPQPTSQGLFDICGKLIRRSIINDNKIFLEEKLRYMEDEVFMWNVISFSSKIKYVRKQLYSHYVYPNVNTAASNGLQHDFQTSYFKIIKKNIQKSLKQRGFSLTEIEKLVDQGFIFSIISALVSYSRSIILGKVNRKNAIKIRKKIIKNVLSDDDVCRAIKNYSPSKNENPWIPRSIAWGSCRLLEFACTRRAKEILRIRRQKEN